MTGLAVTVLLGVLVDVSSGMMSISLIPQYPVIQGSVTLSVTGNTGTIQSFFWYKGSETSSPCHILSYSPHKEIPLTTGQMYNHRLTAFPNGSLLIYNLTSTDQGHYVVRADLEKMVDEAFILLHVYGLSVDTSIQVPIYENTAMDQGASTDSDYTSLQFKSEDIYTALKELPHNELSM
ncbi:cell adhesion molecule CEACAM19 isoform X3 [Aquarana catesbeiana]|uniref:cell adhesion molecule CEACAM19 isoform X3 n=1 Tax=Aquarana catesbeiana TaxID=8400 RepID=UPI003CC94181